MPTTDAITGAFKPLQPGATQPKKQDDLFSSASFMKLLGQQMKNQNPLEPMKDMEFIGQMAQFSMLEQVTKMSQGMESLNVTSELAQRASLIGKQVTYAGADGTTATGTVQRLVIDNVNHRMRLVVNGTEIDPSTVVRVEAAA
jgi:flagellar basal-body rod modification protein FlgD